CNTFIGQDKTLDDLFAEGYDSIFIGTGTHIPQDVRMENDEVPGVFQAMYLLTNVQLVENGELDENQIPVKKGDRVIIIGGGNVAMDAARTCVRLGCEAVTVAYRRSQEQMPALLSEYEEARAEGVQFQWFASPVGVEGTDKVKPNARLVGEGNNLKVDEKGYIITSEDPYGMTSREGVFAGGDVVHKPATVVLAMREAKKAVDGMVKYMEIKKAQESVNQ
ncbi:MAG: FAD-dependent oxidoreductase, partial [Veillonella sp.]|nr:FAD-dependent oxidoreductase [Veillonella sp.]